MASNRDDSSLEDVAVLSSTRAFAQDALLQFQLGKFNKCLTALQEFLKRKANNPKNPKAAISAPKPSWFSPERLLLILCLDNLIKRGDFKLNNFQDGVLSFAFMVGPLVALPIFASLGKRLVGVGEASLIILAAPFIDDHAPADQASNLLYVDQPIGTRFSYTFDRSDICHSEDGVSNNLSDFLQVCHLKDVIDQIIKFFRSNTASQKIAMDTATVMQVEIEV